MLSLLGDEYGSGSSENNKSDSDSSDDEQATKSKKEADPKPPAPPAPKIALPGPGFDAVDAVQSSVRVWLIRQVVKFSSIVGGPPF